MFDLMSNEVIEMAFLDGTVFNGILNRTLFNWEIHDSLFYNDLCETIGCATTYCSKIY